MRVYQSGKWGFALIWGLRASVFPQAFALALPNALLAFLLATYYQPKAGPSEEEEENAKNAIVILAAFTSVLFWVLYFRSTVAYNRWWEGGTLLQQTRGEWFNAYSSLIAFSSTDPEKVAAVEAYHHQLARFMSLLFCSALQQVSPNPDRPFEIIDSTGIDPESLEFLFSSSDRVEVILQWIQRSTILNMQTGILPIPPPVMSRAFQEISRGIVNLQNARKIADFPFPFPYAQTSIVMLLVHWGLCPFLSSALLKPFYAAVTSFASIFFLWCMNYTALKLEMPFGTEANDLPMDQMQSEWNKSVGTLLAKRAQSPPYFHFEADKHRRLEVQMSDGAPAGKRRMTVGKYLEVPRRNVSAISMASKMSATDIPSISQTPGAASTDSMRGALFDDDCVMSEGALHPTSSQRSDISTSLAASDRIDLVDRVDGLDKVDLSPPSSQHGGVGAGVAGKGPSGNGPRSKSNELNDNVVSSPGSSSGARRAGVERASKLGDFPVEAEIDPRNEDM